MREFIIKTLIAAGVTGTWAGFTVSEFGPSLEGKKAVPAAQEPPSVQAAPSPPGRFGKEPRNVGGTDEGP